MSIGIGVDTGGTYTDAVAYDFETKTILSGAKALTTREDLSLGIEAALSKLPPQYLKEASVAALSTTLATNACVEDTGGRSRLLFIGADEEIVREIGADYGFTSQEDICFLESKGTLSGEIITPPDWDLLDRQSETLFQGCDAAAAVEVFAGKNNAVLEKKAREILSRRLGIPIVCGHELFQELSCVRRGAGALLNARLIPVIRRFLTAVKAAFNRLGVTAPIVIVRSDGSLMSEAFTQEHPVETLLCGPASSVIGGMKLSGVKDGLVVDMGGTTTDIALVKDFQPLHAEDGVQIGKWRTYVKGIYIDTFGLGGDSALRFDKNRELTIGPQRAIPLSIIGAKYPSVIEKLERLTSEKPSHTRPLHEFICLAADIQGDPRYSQQEQDFCKRLEDSPLILTDAAAAMGTDVYNFHISRLEREGVVLRAGVTPTDIMHLKGDFSDYSTEAARLGARFLAGCLGIPEGTFPDVVYEAVKKKLYCNIARLLLENRDPYYRKHGLDPQMERFIGQCWEDARHGGGFLQGAFQTPAALVGVGAPIHVFLPDVAKALGTECIIPPYAGIANAMGAVAGDVAAECEIWIKPSYSADGIGEFILYGETENLRFESLEEAQEAAFSLASRRAKEKALERGAAGEPDIKVIAADENAAAKDCTVYLGTRILATATGNLACSPPRAQG